MQFITNNIVNPENPIIPTIVPYAGIAEVSIDKKNYVVNSREFNTIIHNEFITNNIVNPENPIIPTIVPYAGIAEVSIDKNYYVVNSREFNTIIHNEYNNLIIREGLGEMERIGSLLRELVLTDIDTLICYSPSHGGFIPIKVSSAYNHVYLLNVLPEHKLNILKNIENENISNINWEISCVLGGCVVFAEKCDYIDIAFIKKYHPIIIAPTSIKILKTRIYTSVYELSNTQYSVYIPHDCNSEFYTKFKYCIKTSDDGDEILEYDNLVNLCVMVKNGGKQFGEMLEANMKYIDRWTILDTGSTDDTVETIKRVLVGKKPGELYEEPFINFRDSRNRLLELAGTTCKYSIMLDDTYVLQGDLREFLNEVRGDQFADSFSLYINSDDVEYASNRIVVAESKLKYIYTIHEVIQKANNNNVIIPKDRSHIIDRDYDYMKTRTVVRKQKDLEMLYQELEENPNDPRPLYYLAQTYNLLEDYENAFKYFMERANHPVDGFLQEKIDAIFEAGRCANFKLNKPWEECEELYNRAYVLDKRRPESIYFIGVHHYMEGNKKKAYEHFKLAFEIGYPAHVQYSLKPTLSFHFLPKMLTQLCYDCQNYELGEKCAKLYLSNNDRSAEQYHVIESFYNMFVKLNAMNNSLTIKIQDDSKNLLCFVADGGFDPWTGADIQTKGVGGSETYIIEMARYIQKNGAYKVIVFCNCLEQSTFEGVEYIPIAQFMPFAKSQVIHTCIISRFSEYVPVAIHGLVENVYLVLHDLLPSGIVIPLHYKVKQLFCLTEWHVEYVSAVFPQYADKIVPLYYGIDINTFDSGKQITGGVEQPGNNIRMQITEYAGKIPFKFIYSSYPNRGLYQLLQMWPEIVRAYPAANLHIYADVDGNWVNNVEPTMMQNIRDLYAKYDAIPGGLNIHKYGWVDKKTLAEAWRTAEYWFYPCTFMETFCLTAVEAAISRTLAITNGLAALQNTVGDRGICIPGDAKLPKWQKTALIELFDIMENHERRTELIEKNYQWAKTMSWESQSSKLVDYINKN
jgi:tetratricopeptide (TPR) repeat protein